MVADSSSCLPADVVERYGIRIVPLGLMIGGEVYPDGFLTPAEMFARIDASRERPMSTSPAPGDFLAAFGSARDAGAESVLCLTLSAKYSGTHAAAMSAADLATDHLPGFDVRVVDTGGLAMTHGFAVLTAARALEAGAEAGEAVATAVRVGQRGRLVGALTTMRYLVQGGRVPWIVGWVGGALGIRPVMAFENGDAKSVARSRTMAGACDRMLDHMAKSVDPGRALHVAVMKGMAETALVDRVRQQIEERFSPVEVLHTGITSVMSVHTGPGFLGVAFYQDE